jgi:hypothetical protein
MGAESSDGLLKLLPQRDDAMRELRISNAE